MPASESRAASVPGGFREQGTRRNRAAVNAYGALKPVHYAYDLALPQRAIRSGIPTGPALGGIGSGPRRPGAQVP